MKKWVLIFCFYLAACTTIKVPQEFKYEEIQTSTFKIATWQKISNPRAEYKMYIEGDGHAFRANGMISSDPTPRSIMMREIAFADSHANVIYMARPCQFVKDNMCAPQYWSTARFSKESIQAQYEAIKQIAGDGLLTLVGFSGGAQTAGLVAVKYDDLNIAKLVTVAGNLDLKDWTDYHDLPELNLSDDLKNYRMLYAKFQQIHYVGSEDENIVPAITEQFVADKKTIIYVYGATHNSGWQKAYQQIRAE